MAQSLSTLSRSGRSFNSSLRNNRDAFEGDTVPENLQSILREHLQNTIESLKNVQREAENSNGNPVGLTDNVIDDILDDLISQCEDLMVTDNNRAVLYETWKNLFRDQKRRRKPIWVNIYDQREIAALDNARRELEQAVAQINRVNKAVNVGVQILNVAANAALRFLLL
ncbi:hypothetical protein [Candidatus Uabimicrobium amorphum]|uniref:Uncharacterized protein n=1 Tax=Uabimicrobium amorphum TaxID=2596890 RepID=A0A5S9F547_UABAM|nr:hypothetical protein [Candidatus Uabimicrobium amorphum]BBM86228.1 hypothetical protein UABAM_04614 [Candidatus Uabimicrobium amorphum]